MKKPVSQTVLVAGVLALVFTAAEAATPAAATTYQVKGSYYETCACAVSCPCASNVTLPTEGHCDAISLIHIDKGAYGTTPLDGLNVAVVMRSPHGVKVKDTFEKGEMDLFTLYLDDKATAQQKDVMPKVLAALFGTQEIKGSKPPQWVPMSLSVEGDVAKLQIDGGKKLAFEIEQVDVGDKTKLGYKKGDIKNRIALSNTAPFPWVRDVTQGISKTFTYSDLGTSWEYKNRNAFFGTVSASGK